MKRCCPELLPENMVPATPEEISERKRASEDDWISDDEVKEAALRSTQQVSDPFFRQVLQLRFGMDRGGKRRTPIEVADALGGKYAGKAEYAQMLIRRALRSVPLVADDPSRLQVIYEDDDLIAVCKPPFLRAAPVHRFIGKSLTSQLIGYMQKHTEKKDGQSGAAAPWQPRQLHRLDQNTSGVVLFAKTKEAAAFMHRQWHGPACRKVYLAVASLSASADNPLSCPGDTVLIDAPIGADEESGDHIRRAVNYKKGQSAATQFTVLAVGMSATGQRASLLQCCLKESGRTHQIRVHAAHTGSPLVGDEIYNQAYTFNALDAQRGADAQSETAALISRVALHAWRLQAPHPRSKDERIFEAPPPADFLSCLAALGIGWPLPAPG